MAISIREARDSDAPQIRDVFLACYGHDYCYPEFYEIEVLKRLIYAGDTLMLSAEDSASGRVVGTASVLLEIGAYSDLVGEFGRLAVHPEFRQRGVGTRLMERRLELVRGRLHVAMSETRVAHSHSLRIGSAHHFAPLGFLPLKLLFNRRESAALMVRYFGDALNLRRNHPRIVPEAYLLAKQSMDSVGLRFDAVVDEDSPSYPYNEEFELVELTEEGYSTLLRIERGRVRKRDVFGPLRLHYGYFKLQAEHSTYLLARRDEAVVGAIGFTHDRVEKTLRVFEIISLEDDVIRFLLTATERRCREDWDVAYIELDVSAYAPRMQRTLVELGFIPVAYAPAFAFHRVERLDIVKMARLLVPAGAGPVELTPSVERVAELVLRGFESRQVLPRIGEAVGAARLFAGLSEEQSRRLAAACRHEVYDAGTRLFAEGEPSDAVHILLAGRAALEIGGAPLPGGAVEAGECLGELSLLSASAHSATAVAISRVEAAVIPHADLVRLVRQRPDIGMVLYRNLAQGLGDKLKRTDATLLLGNAHRR